MTQFLNKIIPVIIIFLIGIFTRKIKLLQKKDADLLLKVVFYLTIPALTFISVAKAELSLDFVYLPLISITMIFIAYFSAKLISSQLELPAKTRGTFLVGSMIMNTGFTLPFVISAFGKPGVAVYTFFDFGNVLMIFTFVFYIAIRHGKNSKDKIDFRKFLKLPPLWGLLAGFIVNILNLEIPILIENFCDTIGLPTIFLMMLSLGIYFNPIPKNLKKISLVLFTRIGIGMLFGFLITILLNLEGIMRVIVIAGCGAPVGYNTLVFATLENLDKEFAASIVSISILLGIIYVPILMLFL